MGVLDSIMGQLGGAVPDTGKGGQAGWMDAIAGLIGGGAGGGIQGLVSSFTEKGLGDLVSSWIGTGENKPVSGAQIQSAVGGEQVQAIADKLGVSRTEASNGLANLLPQVIDKLTPDGKLPEGGLLEQGLSLLKGLGG